MAAMSAIPLHLNPSVSYTGDIVAAMNGSGKREERIPQWGYQETKDFIAIRSELEKDFTQTKRNKSLWEIISAKMKERGHRRSADQCKCKWKNLYNRYKAMTISQGMESTDLESGRPCPFYEELHAIFTESEKSPDGLLMETERAAKKKGRKGLSGERSSEDCSEEEEEEEEESEEERAAMKRSAKRARSKAERPRATAEKCRANTMQEVLEEFFQQQQRVEREWMEAVGRREEERRAREQEWRDAMQQLERERLAREQQWREREEQRRAREEARAQKRDALFSALLSRLAG